MYMPAVFMNVVYLAALSALNEPEFWGLQISETAMIMVLVYMNAVFLTAVYLTAVFITAWRLITVYFAAVYYTIVYCTDPDC